MVRFGMAAAALALMASPLFAQDTTEQLKKELQDLRSEVDALKAVNTTKEIPSSGKVAQDAMAADDNPVMTLFKQTKLSGFVDAGYQVSFNGMHKEGASDNRVKGTGTVPVSANGGNPIRIFDDRSDSFYLNAVQLNLERLASKDMIVGYHIELAGGHDPSIYDGNTVTIQEGWLQIMAPLGDGLDIRVGKMATLAGYEVLENVNNMNYSRGMLFGLIQPFTHTGIRASYWFGQQFGATIGFNNGLNATNRFADQDAMKMVEFQLAAKPMKDLSIAATFLYSHETPPSNSTGDGTYLFDLVVAYTMDKLTLGLNFDMASSQGVIPGTLGTFDRAPLSGVALYAKYAFTDTLSEALRIEYFSDKEGAFINAGGASGARVFSLTATTEMKVAQQLILRFELRADNSNDRIFTRGGGSSTVASPEPLRAARGDYTLGFEAIMPF